MVVTARGKKLDRAAGSGGRAARGQRGRVVAACLRQYTPAARPDLPPFTAGGVGYFAYDMVRQFELLPERAKDDLGLPDCVFTFYDRLLAFDHLRHQVHIIAAADVASESPRKAYDRALADIEAIERKLARGVRSQHVHWSASEKKKAIKVHVSTSHDQFVESVRTAKEYIRCPCRRRRASSPPLPPDLDIGGGLRVGAGADRVLVIVEQSQSRCRNRLAARRQRRRSARCRRPRSAARRRRPRSSRRCGARPARGSGSRL